MPNLIAYGVLSLNDNARAGNLVKAQCIICGQKYGNIKEAKDCEEEHIKILINKELRLK